MYQIAFPRPLKRATLVGPRSNPAALTRLSLAAEGEAPKASSFNEATQATSNLPTAATQQAAALAVAAIAEQLTQYESQWGALRHQMQQLAVAAATEMARGIVGYEVQHHTGRLEHLLDQTLQDCNPQCSIQMFVNRDDRERFASVLQHHPAMARRIQLSIDESLDRGDCIFVSDRESVIAEWNRQLVDLHERVMECLTDAWAE